MAVENMKKISQAEEEAAAIRRQAQDEARKIVSDAKKEAAGLKREMIRQAEDSYDNAIAFAEGEAQNAYDSRLASAQDECQAMRDPARERMAEAAEFIIRKVVNASVDS